MNSYSNIPTNIICGFLGVGKTTAIQHLLKCKPDNERWAVIVNEFGQIGIDGALLRSDSVEIKEIAGGCLCCVGSQSLSVGLNQIIRNIKPHRILIEPTGLGHPAKLIDALTAGFYKTVLDVKAIINLLDARQLTDKRYTENEIFIDQSGLADVLIANKLDVYSDTDKQNFYAYVMSFQPPKTKVAMVDQGQLQLAWLNLNRLDNRQAEFTQSHQHHHHQQQHKANNSQNWLMVEGRGSGYMSTGWRINKQFQFIKSNIPDWLKSVFEESSVERVKGLMHTDKGWLSINHSRHEQQILNTEAHDASILEVISSGHLNSNLLNEQLKAQLVK